MSIFTKLKKILFGRKAKIERHDLELFHFDILGQVEVKKYFLRRGNVLYPNYEVVKRHYDSCDKASYTSLDDLFKFSWCKYWADISSNDLKLVTSDNFILLSYDDDRRNEILLRFAEKSFDQIHEVFTGIIPKQPGKTLIFHLNRDLYHNLEDTLTKSEFVDDVMTGGMFVNAVIPYMVFHSETGFDLPDITLAHELTHALLSDNDIPMWLNEALACTMEKVITGQCHYDWSLEKGLENVSYWDSKTIQKFWSGDSFFLHESQDFSYLLAQGLFNIIVKDHPDNFKNFIKYARSKDAGEAAARKYLGVSLAQLTISYLGMGYWTPSKAYLT